MVKQFLYAVLTSLLLVGCAVDAPKAKDARSIKLDPVQDKVAWSVSATSTTGNEWEVNFHADIDEGWSVYSVENFGEMGPLPSRFEFDSLAHQNAKGEVIEVSEHTCLLYTSDAADERSSVDLGGRRIIKKKR